MPDFTVKVTLTFPTSALDAENALSMVPTMIRMKHPAALTEGKTEVIDDSMGKVVLKAKLRLE